MDKNVIRKRIAEIEKQIDEAWRDYLAGKITLKEYQTAACPEEYSQLVKELNKKSEKK